MICTLCAEPWAEKLTFKSGCKTVSLRVSPSLDPTSPRITAVRVIVHLILLLIGPVTEWKRYEKV